MGEAFPVSVRIHDGAPAFLARAEAWLMRAEAEHNLILGVVRGLVESDAALGGVPPFLATVECGGEVVGCAFRTPPWKLGLTGMPAQAMTPLAQAVAARYRTLPAVLAPPDEAEAFARAWSAHTGQGWSRGMRQAIYRLEEVTHPTGVGGEARAAEAGDLTLIAAWGADFTRSVGAPFHTSRQTLEAWVAQRALFLWEAQGLPVSMAVAHGRTPRGVRVGFVYTPPERRRHGYASALVAEVSQRMLEGGADFCVLYTDLANPTSNSIYQRIGYRQVREVVDLDFDAVNRDGT